MSFDASVLTLFPEMFPGPLCGSLSGKALEKGIWSLTTVQIRDFATDKRKSVDDTPAGGGAGMVMRADVILRALDAVVTDYSQRPVLYMSPRGRVLNQDMVQDIAKCPGVVILCGRFEGIDERVLQLRPMIEEVSIGDCLLSGGELAAMVLLDACIRLLPGVMGSPQSGLEESLANGLLEYPHYTRPQIVESVPIPEVLSSGNHELIRAWRQAESERITAQRRPDLWLKYKDKLQKLE